MWSEKVCLEKVKDSVKKMPDTLVVLGSGWNRVLEIAKIETRTSYSEIFGVKTSVPGHSGELIIATVNGKRCVFMSGRFHLYEGYSAQEATLPIKILAELGVKKMIVTSASGALNPEYRVGDFVVLSDILTLFLKSNPLIGPKFIDMSAVFDQDLRAKAERAMETLGLQKRTGVYAYMSGPHYETPADKKALLTLGSDCVGMSTVPETLMAREMGCQVLGLSFITNLAFVKHDHKEVIAAAEASSAKMAQLIEQIV